MNHMLFNPISSCILMISRYTKGEESARKVLNIEAIRIIECLVLRKSVITWVLRKSWDEVGPETIGFDKLNYDLVMVNLAG